MSLSYRRSEEQQLLASTARRFLEQRATSEAVRELMMTERGFDADVWREAAGLGWPGLMIPEEFGGAGYGFAELSVVFEELGRSVACGPFLSSMVLATTAILQGANDAQRAELLPALASGERIATLAVAEAAHTIAPQDIATTATADGDGFVLTGTKRWVLDGLVADTLVIAARTGDDTVGLFVVPTDTPGVTVTRQPTVDATRKLADVTLDGVRVGADALLGGRLDAWGAAERALAIGSVAVACEQVGVAQKALEVSLDYAKTRFQFGRAIGSFQAIKHKLADMLVKVEHARSTAIHAALTVDDADEFAIAEPLAATICSSAATFVTAEAIQVHGGIGFTWEHDAHLWFKRAKSNSLLLRSPRDHRTRLADAVGL